MRATSLPGFQPSRHGFQFANRWPAGPVFQFHAGYLRAGIGEAADGLCGGMCFAAADRFLRGEPIPPGSDAPEPASALFHEIARRQLDSLDHLAVAPIRFWSAAAMLATGRWTAARQAAEWRRLCRDIDLGRPAMAGLVRSAGVNPLRLTTDHQVLGFAYEATAENGRLRIYDPNHPGADDVEIRIRRASAPQRPVVMLAQSTGEPLLAVLRLPYQPPAGSPVSR